MKTATLPAIDVEPALRDEIEAALRAGETLPDFLDAAVRGELHRRTAAGQAPATGAPVSQGEDSAPGEFYAAEDVLRGLQGRLDDALRRKADSARR